jgi:HlyD family secretion protein
MPKSIHGLKFKSKRSKRIFIISLCAVCAAAVVGGVLAAALGSSTESTTTFRAAKAQTGTISNYLSESGTASTTAQYDLTASNAGTVDSVSVSQGDSVKKGQVIAHISETASSETLASKKSALATAQSDLASAQSSLSSLYVKSPFAGRVKSVKVEAGDDAATVSSAYGYLMYVTNGYLQVSLGNVQGLSAGDSVTVTAGGAAYSGTVDSSGSGTVVTVNSDVPALGTVATVYKNGAAVGSGKLTVTSEAYKVSASGSSGGSGGSSSSSGSTVTAVYVSEGQTVSKGTWLLKYDSTSVERTIAQKQASLEQAEKEVTNAQASVDKDTITAPADGVVASLSVKAGSTLQNGGSVATIIDQNQMETVLSVDEDDISSIKVGQTAQITLDAISGKTFTGKVTKVNSLGTTSNNVTTYSVYVSIDSPTGINVGMTTNAKIITESKENTVVVSSSAVLEKRGTTGYVIKSSSLGSVTQLKNVTTQELIEKYGTKVTIGLSNSGQVEITEGLSSGDTVEIPVTVNLKAVKSLKTSSSTSSSAMGGMGGDMGGMGGTGGGGGTPPSGFGGGTGGGTGGTQKSGGTGNTVSKSS